MKNSIGRLKVTPMLIFAVLLALFLILSTGRDTRAGGSMTQLEKRISETLSEMDGVGSVKVVIRTRTQQSQSKTIGIQNQEEEIPCGALAVAQGADHPIIRMKLIHALCAVLGLQQSEVDVIALGEEVK